MIYDAKKRQNDVKKTQNDVKKTKWREKDLWKDCLLNNMN